MGKRYVPNTTDHVIFVGGLMIQPGDGREVDEIHLPPEVLEAAAEETGSKSEPTDAEKLDANLREVLKGPLTQIKPMLVTFSPESLARLLELEQADGTPRKGLVEAISELQLERAQKATGGAPT